MLMRKRFLCKFCDSFLQFVYEVHDDEHHTIVDAAIPEAHILVCTSKKCDKNYLIAIDATVERKLIERFEIFEYSIINNFRDQNCKIYSENFELRHTNTPVEFSKLEQFFERLHHSGITF